MKVLVTGANGYLGQGIVNELIDLGHYVIATDIDISNISIRADRRVCDLFSIEDPYAYFDQPEIVLHLAWRDGFIHYSDAHIDDLSKHYHFIKSLAKSSIKTIAIMGSVHEVGFYEGSVNEDTPCNPITPYGICKNAFRELASSICNQNDINFMWLRGFYIVGNSCHGSSIFSKLSAAVNAGKKTFPFTLGQNQFDFVDYSEFCNQVSMAVTQNEVNGIINICSGYPEKLADRVERFIKENNYSIKLEYGAFPERPYDSKAIWGDNTKIELIKRLHNK